MQYVWRAKGGANQINLEKGDGSSVLVITVGEGKGKKKSKGETKRVVEPHAEKTGESSFLNFFLLRS
jgi:hypothetical protein